MVKPEINGMAAQAVEKSEQTFRILRLNRPKMQNGAIPKDYCCFVFL
jgi:predicted Zn-dependent protease